MARLSLGLQADHYNDQWNGVPQTLQPAYPSSGFYPNPSLWIPLFGCQNQSSECIKRILLSASQNWSHEYRLANNCQGADGNRSAMLQKMRISYANHKNHPWWLSQAHKGSFLLKFMVKPSLHIIPFMYSTLWPWKGMYYAININPFLSSGITSLPRRITHEYYLLYIFHHFQYVKEHAGKIP
jgi:hypothetical protein